MTAFGDDLDGFAMDIDTASWQTQAGGGFESNTGGNRLTAADAAQNPTGMVA